MQILKASSSLRQVCTLAIIVLHIKIYSFLLPLYAFISCLIKKKNSKTASMRKKCVWKKNLTQVNIILTILLIKETGNNNHFNDFLQAKCASFLFIVFLKLKLVYIMILQHVLSQNFPWAYSSEVCWAQRGVFHRFKW